jgi:hypothetical protein
MFLFFSAYSASFSLELSVDPLSIIIILIVQGENILFIDSIDSLVTLK